MNTPEVSAVLVTWNSGDSFADAVAALRESADLAGVSMQLVVVDNASSDGSLERVELREGDVGVRNPVNAGYGPAAAQGAELASGRWILFVNPDAVVQRGFLSAIREAWSSLPDDVAVLVPELRQERDPDRVNSRGVTVDEVGVPAEIDTGEVAEDTDPPAEVFGGTTGCCLVRADALRGVGGFELCYFAYLDDVDLALRLQLAGFRARFVPNAIARHEGSASLGEGSPVKTFLVARNRRILFRLHGPHSLRARLWRTMVEAGHVSVSMLASGGIAPVTGRLDALRLRRYTRFVSRSRARNDVVVSSPPFSTRRGLMETLRRKRTVTRRPRQG